MLTGLKNISTLGSRKKTSFLDVDMLAKIITPIRKQRKHTTGNNALYL